MKRSRPSSLIAVVYRLSSRLMRMYEQRSSIGILLKFVIGGLLWHEAQP